MALTFIFGGNMRFLVITLLLSFFTFVDASACDLKKIPFGSSIDRVVNLYKLDYPEILDVDKQGEFMTSEMGKVVCDELPEKAIMEFAFIDNVFVKIKIYNPDTSEALLQYAKKTFGENDDKNRKKSSDGKTSIALWNGDALYNVLYSTRTKDSGGVIESIDISSKMHSGLFAKIDEQRGKDIDAYLKEKGLGKYSAEYKKSNRSASSSGSSSGSAPASVSKGSSGSDESGETVDENYNPDSLDSLKNSYEKKHKAWKKKNEANPGKGR